MLFIKGKISIKIQQEFKVIQKEFWGRHLCARGYFAASSGNVTDEILMQYIENQDVEKKMENLRLHNNVLSRL